jgi:predicted TIM-barrel fold metal-dependent hydrolase
MTTVIDVDCHFDVPIAPGEHPLAAYSEQLPPLDAFIADSLTGDLLHQTPEPSRPRAAELTPYLPDENTSSAEQATRPGEFAPRFPLLSPADRVAWLDQVGIDHAFVNPGGYGFLLPYVGNDPEAVRRCNDFMADRLSGYTDRLVPVALVDWTDTDSSIAELARMRAKGSRAFWARAEPLDAVSPGHPAMDPLWAAATDLGMIAILHVGNVPTRFDGGWADMGWERPGSTGTGGFFRFANSFRHQAAEMMIGALVYGGVFGRHPNLTVLTEELHVAWLPEFAARVASLDIAGPWPFELAPSEMLRSNVRATPLIGLGDGNVLDGIFTDFSDMLVFSSDYPHGEGNPDPIELYEPQLSALDPELRSQFLGENIAACLARMGDPLDR